MIVSIPDAWIAARQSHNEFLLKLIDNFLDPKYKPRKGNKPPLRITIRFVSETKELLTSNSLADLLKSISIFNNYKVRALRSKPRFEAEISKLFNYRNFCAKKKSWDAYKLCTTSNITTCPYCQQLELPTVIDKVSGRGFRPALDHFFHKDQYPHLALSLTNLIPSCTACNTSLKGEIDFFENLHLHPYFDQENIKFAFLRVSGELFLWDDFSEVNDLLLIASPERTCEKTKKSISTFLINQRYQENHIKFEAMNYAQAKLDWESTKNNDQIAIIREARHNEVSLTQFDRSNYKNVRLGKLRADIHDALT
ncbi:MULTISPECIES: hypothetical protein [unclassified Pseudomonas]|uniref:hypothetical protein n=1 Tax=unclassified Pseudomonas TaxID=196821 RepID=UPI00159FFFAD|nr:MULTISPECIES: hypothetical protein [unclassified Pseudomonas]NWC95038.1 hypothetical protein [Pseudomonas sp. IPO3779]NWD18302.1 hypothetical protein [Pseudomonas sp. IPO3778]